jgi:acyl-CoA synthetase (AMP-forming)/AMP-acid ligase II
MWIWEWMQPGRAHARLLSGTTTLILDELAERSAVGKAVETLRGRSVLIATVDALTAALALLELDGVVRRLVLAPPDLKPAHLRAVIDQAQVEALVTSAPRSVAASAEQTPSAGLARQARELLPETLHLATDGPRQALSRRTSHQTEWILMTSGTSGPPKLVVHSLASLTDAFARAHPDVSAPVWGTFYDIRRYGGLQILLRALRGATLVLPAPAQGPVEQLSAAAAAGVTHMTGTASHWRSVLMSGQARRLSPRYVRLSGEIADQGILDALHEAYPQACIAHAFASTEAGVAFEVEDGRAGFPASWVGGLVAGSSVPVPRSGTTRRPGEGGGPMAELRIVEETLRMRSGGTARGYLSQDRSLRDADGFVDTGDRVQQREGRCYFLGRSGGIINVGGLKVHPEEVEAVINAQPWVRVSLVSARRNPITGAIVSAEVVLREAADGEQRPAESLIIEQILAACRATLPAHKVPAVVRAVASLPVSAAGKLVRPGA